MLVFLRRSWCRYPSPRPICSRRTYSPHKKLIEIGIPEEYLVRHNEYIELSKAEAFFLLEHINFSNLEKDNIKSVRSHFEQVKNIIRIKELNKRTISLKLP